NNKTIFDSFEEEREEKMKSLCSDSIYSENIFLKNLNIYNRVEAEITGALNYAKGLNFSKNPLKSSYLSHPLRLASFLLQFEPTIPTNYIIIALLHNVPETTDISINEI